MLMKQIVIAAFAMVVMAFASPAGLSAQTTRAMWVGETFNCDATSAVMGLTSDVSWTTNGGYFSLDGSGFYRNVTVTQYFSGQATVECTWRYRLYPTGSWSTQSCKWTFTCNENPVSISPTSMTLNVGESGTLTYSHQYSNAYLSAANVRFSSNNSTVASVDAYGEVTALSEGTAYVTIYSKLSDAAAAPSCKVTVLGGSPDPGPDPDGTGSGAEIVDLGLSVNWASVNIGASSEFDSGDYFAWGETSPKNVYTESNSRFYNTNAFDIGTIEDGICNLPSSCDAACARWGAPWRMPEADEINELIDRCDWTWTSRNGKNGYNVTGPSGKSIFLPAAGMYDCYDVENYGSVGSYWSISTGRSHLTSLFLGFGKENVWNGDGDRYVGRLIRPVTDQAPSSVTPVEGVDGKVCASEGMISFHCDDDVCVRVYTISGLLVFEQRGAKEVELGAGVYIVQMDGETVKTVVY